MFIVMIEGPNWHTFPALTLDMWVIQWSARTAASGANWGTAVFNLYPGRISGNAIIRVQNITRVHLRNTIAPEINTWNAPLSLPNKLRVDIRWAPDI